MTEQKHTLGIIGLGGVAQVHLNAYESLDTVSIASVCDVRAELAHTVAEKYQAKAFTDYRDLLAHGGVDLVLVLTPASTHRAIVEAVAAAGLPVLCEKPLAVTREDGEAMVRACDVAGVKLFYGSCYRYLPAVKKAHELIQSGAIGQIQLMTEQMIGGHGAANYKALPPIHYPLGGPGGPGMGLVDHGVHLIDIFSWFTDEDIVSVQGQGQISGAPATSEFMVMQFSGGATGHLVYNAATYSTGLPSEGMFSGGQGYLADSSIAQAGLWENEPGSIAVYGTRGALRIFHYTNALFMNKGAGPEQVELSGRPAFGHFASQLEDCLDAIATERAPSVSGADGLRALTAMLEVYR